MKPLYALLLTVVLTLSATVALSISDSSATELCTEISEACKEEGILGEGATVVAKLKSSTQAVFVTSAGKVSCEQSAIEGETTAEEQVPLPIAVSAMSFSTCKLGETKCTLKPLNLPYSASLYAGEGGDGTLYINEEAEESGLPGQEIACGGSLNCSYSTFEIELGLDAGEPTTLAAKEIELEGEGKACAEALLSLEYELSSPNEGQVAAAQGNRLTRLCKANQSPCTSIYLGDQELRGVNGQAVALIIKPLDQYITCNESKLIAASEQKEGTPLKMEFFSLSFVDCETEKKGCTVEAFGTPYIKTDLVSIVPPAGPVGDGRWQIRMRLEVKCAGVGIEKCKYEKLVIMGFDGGNPGQVWVSGPTGTLARRPGGYSCWQSVLLSALYPLKEQPNSTIYVTN